MVSKLELDKAFAVYEKNKKYLDELDGITSDAYVDSIGKELQAEYEPGPSERRLSELLRRDVKKITDIITALQVINKGYRDGDSQTKDYIDKKLQRLSSGYSRFDQITQLRLLKDDLTHLLKGEKVQYVPPIPRKAKRSAPKNRARATATPKLTAKKSPVKKPAAKKPAAKKSVAGQARKITSIRF